MPRSRIHGPQPPIFPSPTAPLALVAFIMLRQGDDRVTSESSGIAVPVPTALDSLPPLTFPLPDTDPVYRLLPSPLDNAIPQIGVFIVEVPPGNERAAAQKLRANPHIEFVEFDTPLPPAK